MMKKLVGVLVLVVMLTSCKNTGNEPKTTEKKEVKKEAKVQENTRKADVGKTKFVLFKSSYNPKETYVKMKDYLESKGMFHPHLVDHQTAAANVDIKLRPIYLVIFGNPKAGSVLMLENPEVAIELPLKALIYQDEEGQTWVMYKDMNYLKDLYFIKDPNGIINKMNNLMEGFKQAVYNPIHTTQVKDEDLK